MYVSRLTFHTRPGQTEAVEQALTALRAMVARAGGANPRILRTHYASLGSPDVVFEQDANSLAELEAQIQQVTATEDFKLWSRTMSERLQESPKREIYLTVG